MLSFDDYHKGNDYIADVCRGLEKEVIFFIDFKETDKAIKQIKKLSKLGFIIGSHTVSHSFLTRIPLEDAKKEITRSKEMVELYSKKKCDYFAYPRGYYNEDIIELVKNAGYKYARTTLLQDGKTKYEKAGFHLSFPRDEYRNIDPFQLARITKLDHYWGHVAELIKFSVEDKFEKFIKWYRKERSEKR